MQKLIGDLLSVANELDKKGMCRKASKVDKMIKMALEFDKMTVSAVDRANRYIDDALRMLSLAESVNEVGVDFESARDKLTEVKDILSSKKVR